MAYEKSNWRIASNYAKCLGLITVLLMTQQWVSDISLRLRRVETLIEELIMQALRYGVYRGDSWVEVNESGEEIPVSYNHLVYSADILEAAEEHADYERRAFRTATITVVDHDLKGVQS